MKKIWDSFFSKENMLDEMQEQRQRRSESYAFWIIWAALAVSIVMQIAMNADMRQLAGETVVFLLGGVYALVATVRNGVWDRHFRANWKANLIWSGGAGTFTFFFIFIVNYLRYGKCFGVLSPLFSGVTGAAVVFAAAFGLLSLCAYFYRRRREKLDRED